MPLDPQLQPLLDLLGGELRVDDKTPDEVRVAASLPEPLDMTGLISADDVEVGGAEGMLSARVYRPEGAAPGGPVIVFFHGGGWVIGSIESHDNTAGRMAVETGCTVVSVEYRLAPEHKFPAPLEDCYSATAWVAEHAVELGVDASRLAVAGDSAGGNLAAAVALLARERGAPAIAYQLLIYPATDITFDYPSHVENGPLNYILSDRGVRWFTDHYIGGAEGVDWRAAPMQADDLSDLPPALVVTAELDPLRDEGEAYARRLEEAGIPVSTIRGTGMIHGFYGFPCDEGLRIRKEVAAAVGAALRT